MRGRAVLKNHTGVCQSTDYLERAFGVASQTIQRRDDEYVALPDRSEGFVEARAGHLRASEINVLINPVLRNAKFEQPSHLPLGILLDR